MTRAEAFTRDREPARRTRNTITEARKRESAEAAFDEMIEKKIPYPKTAVARKKVMGTDRRNRTPTYRLASAAAAARNSPMITREVAVNAASRRNEARKQAVPSTGP